MPINRKWSLEKLMAAARDFPLRNREKLTFEYVLLDQVNDSERMLVNWSNSFVGTRQSQSDCAQSGPGISISHAGQDRVARFKTY